MNSLFIAAQKRRSRKIADEAMLIVAQHGSIAPINIDQRVSYAVTAGTEQGVTETNNGKAVLKLVSI